MNKSAFFIVLLIVLALSSSSKITSLEGVLSKLVQLNTVAGKENAEISVLISKVASSVEDANLKFNDFMDGVVNRCNTGKELQNSFINKLEEDIVAIKARSNQANDDNADIEKKNAGYLTQVAYINTDLNDLKYEITKAFEEYKQFAVEAEQKRVIIKTLRDIITDELISPSNGQSFIQVQNFNSKVNELKTLLEKNDDAQFSPLVSALVTLAQNNNFADQGILNQILSVLNNLDKNIKQFRDRQDSNHTENIKILKNRAQSKITQIQTLSDMINSNHSIQTDNTNIIATAEKDIAAIEAEKARKQTEITYYAKICAYEDGIKAQEDSFRASFSEKVRELENKTIDLE